MDTALKVLLRDQHRHEYMEFVAEYRRIARDLGLPRTAEPPPKPTYYRWLSGQIQGLPRGYHCLVLEQMFPGWTAKELFARAEARLTRPAHGGLLSAIKPAVEPEHLTGLWATAFSFDNCDHVDLSVITAAHNKLAAKNSPPEPRTEGHARGFHNDIEFSLFGRHLIGHWRNTSDSYYFGTVHLAVLPGETVLDGYYSAVLSDTQVVSDRWRWIRVEPRSADGIALDTITLAEPSRLYSTIIEHPAHGSPIPLAQLTTEPQYEC